MHVMSRPRTFRPRNIPCPLKCGKYFANATGVGSHLHTHRRQGHQNRPPPLRPPTPPIDHHDDWDAQSDNSNASDGENRQDPLREEEVRAAFEDIVFHPTINGEF
jgi:hypothetical protein